MRPCTGMIPRLLAGKLLGLVAIVVAAGADTAHAQGAGAGASLELPVLGVKVGVPTGVGEWVVRKDDGGDVLQRTRPVNPYLSVLFSVPEPGAKASTCAATMASFAKKGLKKVDRPALVPAGWVTQVLHANSGGEHLLAFCAEHDGDGKQLVALVTYAASIDGPDLTNVTPVMEAVGKAVFDKPVAWPAADKPAAPAAAPAADDEGQPQRLSLPRSGLVLLVGGGGEWEARPGKGARDLVRRVAPDEPSLSVSLELVRAAKSDGSCESLLDQYMATRGKSSLQSKPSYLPDTFHPNAAESYDGGTGRALACAEVPAGFLLATVAYSGSLDAADAASARPVLVAAYHAATNLVEKSGRRSGGFLSGRELFDPQLYLGWQQLGLHTGVGTRNPDGLIPDSGAIMLGVRQARMLRFADDSAFGLAGRYQLQGGWDTQNEMVLDGVVAVGFGVAIDRVTIMPMAGGGGNAIGAGATKAPDKLNLAFEFYNYYGGVVGIEISKMIGVELTGGYVDRGEISEWRWDGQLIVVPASFRKVALSVSYSDMKTVAKVWQVLLGVGF